MIMDEENALTESFSQCKIKEHNDNLKNTLLHLIENDNYTDYLQIYNILMENDIELPPLV